MNSAVSQPTTPEFRRGTDRGASDGAIVIGGDYRGLGLARSLGRRGIPVWVLWEQEERLATSSRYARRSVAIGRRGEPLPEELLRIAREEGLGGWALFPTSDHTVAAVARAYSELAKVFTMTTPPWDVVRWAHDKRLTAQLAQTAGIESPRTFFPRDSTELAALDCEFPVILKPAVKEEFNRFTSAKAWRVDDKRSLVARYDEACLFVPPETIRCRSSSPAAAAASPPSQRSAARGSLLPASWLGGPGDSRLTSAAPAHSSRRSTNPA